MLKWTFIFFIIAIVAGVFGFTGVAAGAATVAKWRRHRDLPRVPGHRFDGWRSDPLTSEFRNRNSTEHWNAVAARHVRQHGHSKEAFSAGENHAFHRRPDGGHPAVCARFGGDDGRSDDRAQHPLRARTAV